MKIVAFLNIETTGLPPKKISSVTKQNADKFPRLVSLHLKFGYYDKNTRQINIIRSVYSIIKPNGYLIPLEVANIHGITNDFATENGLDIDIVLNEIKEIFIGNRDMPLTTSIITHNSKFHLNILKAELLRNDINFDFTRYKIIDLVNFRHGLSYPRLDELYETLYGKKFNKSHNRKSTINVIIKCFEKLYTIEKDKKIEPTNESFGFDVDPLVLPEVKQDIVKYKKRKKL
jgi:DNA polymerase III subunit alpha